MSGSRRWLTANGSPPPWRSSSRATRVCGCASAADSTGRRSNAVPQVAALFATAQAVAAQLGRTLAEGATGGASDGNFTAALGIPTLDGLGAEGDGAHALHEHVLVESIPFRAALLAGLILQIK